MPYDIRTPTPQDSAGIAKVQVNAFVQNPHWALTWGDMPLDEITLGTYNRMPRGLVNGRETNRNQVVVDTDSGEIVGHAKWDFLNVKNASELWLEAQVAEVPAEEKAIYEERWKLGVDENGRRKGFTELVSTRPLAAKCDSIVNGRPFMELELIGTLPSHGRRGVGSMLLKCGIEVAEAAGLPILVMAYACGVGLYQKHGFELITTIDEDYSKFGLSPHTVSFFVRKPGSSVV
ncbi:acyl-CoA N-acyltransferase [Xylariales sp. PMI_506]|nr:acyl-CoA N-acyltransferase [Xylariales sp. PMI_506]